MKLTIWDLFTYIWKHKAVIIIGTVLAFVAANLYVDKIQTYSAEVVIRYKDSCVSEGKALDGSDFDSNEIIAPKVIANAKKNLTFDVKDDRIRSNIKITSIVPSSSESLTEAKQKLGEEYEYHPNTFRIKYNGNSSYYQTRDTLDKLIDSYFKYYNEKYLYLATVSEVDYNLNSAGYDYLEQAEILQDNIDQAIEVLNGYVTENAYRSPTTGMTFNDMIDEFEYLSEFKIPLIFSQIYTARLSTNKDLLINKYSERCEQNLLNEKNSTEKAETAEDRMDAYVDANVDVPNSYNYSKDDNNDDVMIIQDVDDGNGDRNIQPQTTYDELIKNYVTDSVGAKHSVIDADHCKRVIEIFSTAADSSVNYTEYEDNVKSEISDTLSDLKKLYQTTYKMIDDYNAYVPTSHIECLTGVRYYENVYASLYYLVAIVASFSLLCVLAIATEIIKRYASYAKEDNDKDGDEEEAAEADKTGSDSSGDEEYEEEADSEIYAENRREEEESDPDDENEDEE